MSIYYKTRNYSTNAYVCMRETENGMKARVRYELDDYRVSASKGFETVFIPQYEIAAAGIMNKIKAVYPNATGFNVRVKVSVKDGYEAANEIVSWAKDIVKPIGFSGLETEVISIWDDEDKFYPDDVITRRDTGIFDAEWDQFYEAIKGSNKAVITNLE